MNVDNTLVNILTKEPFKDLALTSEQTITLLEEAIRSADKQSSDIILREGLGIKNAKDLTTKTVITTALLNDNDTSKDRARLVTISQNTMKGGNVKYTEQDLLLIKDVLSRTPGWSSHVAGLVLVDIEKELDAIDK